MSPQLNQSLTYVFLMVFLFSDFLVTVDGEYEQAGVEATQRLHQMCAMGKSESILDSDVHALKGILFISLEFQLIFSLVELFYVKNLFVSFNTFILERQKSFKNCTIKLWMISETLSAA